MDPLRPRKGEVDTGLLRRSTLRRDVRTQVTDRSSETPIIAVFCTRILVNVLSKRMATGSRAVTATVGFTELSSTDSEASRSFLEKAFRWRFQEVQFPQGKYLTYRTPDGNQVGIRPAQLAEVPQSVNYVRVADLSQAEDDVRGAGGKIVLPRTDIPGMGSFFWFKIPAGPIMACWQDAKPSDHGSK